MAKRKDSRKAQAEQAINGNVLRAAVEGLIGDGIFSNLKRHGNSKWHFADLILLAVMWVWSNDPSLTGAWIEAHRWSMDVLGRVAIGTYSGFVGALARWTADLLPLLWSCLQQSMEEHGRKHWRVGLWLALAVDGSRLSVPRTEANEKAFCATNYGGSRTAKYRKQKRKKNGSRARKKKPQPIKPQIWITLLWHMGLQMPWSWRTGPSYASERGHLEEMLSTQKFPKNTLFCADAGFTGYDLWTAIQNQGHSFLLRVGANVRLLRKLGYVRERADTVYFWPDHAARKKQPPLVLRLLRLRVGSCDMCLVTNVLDEKQLSVKDAIQLYKLRWGVELQFRCVKQTFGRRKLRSRTPEHAMVELHWSLLGLWMIQLFAVREQIKIGEVPAHCSVSLAIHVIRQTFRRWWEHPEEPFGEQLQTAIKDPYARQRSKKARYRPDYKDKPSAGSPTIVIATKQHKVKLRQYLSMAA